MKKPIITAWYRSEIQSKFELVEVLSCDDVAKTLLIKKENGDTLSVDLKNQSTGIITLMLIEGEITMDQVNELAISNTLKLIEFNRSILVPNKQAYFSVNFCKESFISKINQL